MKKIILFFMAVCVILIVFAGCDDSNEWDEEATFPSEITLNIDQFSGLNRCDAYNLLTDNGFTNIILNPLDDLSSNDVTMVDVIEYVTINGGKDYNVGDVFMSDCSIRIYYHNVKKLFLPFSSDERDEALLYDEMKKEFEEAGFTNVISEPIEDLIFGWLTQDGEIEEIIVDGNKDFKSYDLVAFDTEIIIRYHTFPKNEENNNQNGSAGTVGDKEIDNSEDNDNENSDNEGNDSTEILTVDNCPDLAKLLTLINENDPFIQEFADKYRGKTIEFDGNVASIANHKDYSTRYDILLGCGDYNPNSQRGPNFKFKNVNTASLNLNTLFMEEVLWVGVNVHVVAIVGDYNCESTLFELNPISVTTK